MISDILYHDEKNGYTIRRAVKGVEVWREGIAATRVAIISYGDDHARNMERAHLEIIRRAGLDT